MELRAAFLCRWLRGLIRRKCQRTGAAALGRGKFADGAGLWLVKTDAGRGKWVLRVTAHGWHPRLAVGEGIETALSLACGLLREPATIWAALSTSGMAGLRLPANPDRLTVATDGDAAGRQAGHKLAERPAALGMEPAAPPGPERTLPAPSMQGLTRYYRENQPSGGLFSDEGGKFLGGYAMASENRLATLAAMNDLWGGAPVRVGLGGEGVYTLYGRRLAVQLMVQPGVARAFMADPMAADTGFLPRFLICEPASTIGSRLQSLSRPEGHALADFTTRLHAILEQGMPMDAETRELQPRVLPLSHEARIMIVEFSDHVEAAQAPGGEYAHIAGYASKAAEQACRIAGVLTAWENLDAPEVTGEVMADAIMLAQFYLGEAQRLSDAATVSAEVERADALRNWLLTRWKHPDVLPRDILRLAPIRALRESPATKSAIAMLVKHGWLVPLDPGTEVRGKARKEAYRIVRAGHEV